MDPEQKDEFRELTKQECFDKLSAHEFGRLAVIVDGAPVIFPVNYAFDEPSILIRTGIGSKLDAAPMTQVAMEIDGMGSGGEWGWSVVARGPAFDITATLDEYSEQLRELTVYTLAPGTHDHVLRVSAREVAGRAFGHI